MAFWHIRERAWHLNIMTSTSVLFR